MGEKDLETDKLELSLFGRKRKKGKQGADAEPETAPAEGASKPTPAAEPAPAAEPTPAAAPPAEPTPRPSPEPAPRTAATDETRPMPAASTSTSTSTSPSTSTDASTPRRARGSRVAAKPARQRQLPSLAPLVATLVVGAVVGLLAVALTFASLQLCELFTGTDACGGPGLLVLLVVVLLMILGGSAALSAFGVTEAGGTSFLGVAMFVAVCLVVLLPNLLEPWMIVVAPALCALTFTAAHWVVTRFDEEILETDGPTPHDVR